MNFTRLWNRLKGKPVTHEDELDEEIAFHADMKTRALAAAGADPDEARRQARRDLGNLTLAREQAREAWSFTWLAEAANDLRHGWRGLVSQPGFALAAVLALVLGIGVNAVLFNVYNALAVAPYAVRDPSKTAMVWSERQRGWNGFSWPEYRYLQAQAKSVSGLVATTNIGIRVTAGDSAWSGEAAAVSENLFDVLGTGMVAGRGFSADAARLRDPAPEVVLHYDTWVARFGGDVQVLGRWLEINGHKLQVVGVAAAGFAGPAPTSPHLWIPGAWRDIFEPGSRTIESTGSCCVQVISRLRPGVLRSQAEVELTELSAQFKESIKEKRARVMLTDATLMSNPKARKFAVPLFVVMSVTAGLILLLACANVANLQIARAMSRRREISVRVALGAGRWRVMRQLLAESLLLAGVAGAVSVAVSSWAPGKLVAVITQESRLAIRFDNDYRVMLFIALVTLGTVLASGLLPAWGAVRDNLSPTLREGGRNATASSGRMRTVLLGAQVALSVVLLSGAALLVRALDQVRNIDPGFSPDRVVMMTLGLDGVPDEEARRLIAPVLERVAALPGVEMVAHSVTVPLGNSNMGMAIGGARSPGEFVLGFDRVSANYFETMRMRLLSGGFAVGDENKREVAVINQAAAARLFPSGENPLGKPLTPDSKIIIAGIARNSTTRQFGSEGDPFMWIASAPSRSSRFMIRHAPGAADGLIATLPGLASQLDRRFFASAARYSDTVANGERSASIAVTVAGVVGSLALLLACVGIYGVAAYNVSQRTREIGVRMALGAQPGRILSMVLRQNLRPVLAGGLVGLVGAALFGRLLKSMLYGVAPEDPVALAMVVSVLSVTALLATWAPAKRAAGIDPCVTLRDE